MSGIVKAIGFCGRAFSGKDTAAKVWQELNPEYGKLALADPLKQECVDWGLCSVEEAWVTKPPRIRRLLQIYGTELRRQYDVNYWLCRWADAYLRGLRFMEGVGLVVQGDFPGATVPDLRFPNEVGYFLGFSSPVVYINADARLSRSGKGFEGDAACHASENRFGDILEQFQWHERFTEISNNHTEESFKNIFTSFARGFKMKEDSE